jgi:hypothetical protein
MSAPSPMMLYAGHLAIGEIRDAGRRPGGRHLHHRDRQARPAGLSQRSAGGEAGHRAAACRRTTRTTDRGMMGARISLAKKMKFLGPRKRGRPATGRDAVVKVGVPKFLLDRIDRWAGRFDDMDRSTVLRCLLNLGLSRSRGKPTTVYDPKGFKAHHAKRKVAAPKGPDPAHQVDAPGRRRLVLVKNGALP